MATPYANDDLTLNAYQAQSAATDVDSQSGDPLIPLLGLAGEVGALLAEFKKERRPGGESYRGFHDQVVTELGDILWYLAALARRVDVPMSRVAAVNLAKTRSRWLPSDPQNRPNFDDGFPPDQQLPRQFAVEFTSQADDAGRVRVQMRFEGEELGDPIDDNARYADDYRFHDVFHLSHAAVLGWSPVLRKLIGRKRKADPDIDRAEDGARAAAIEEAVSALVFEMAKAYDYFEGATRVDEAILRAVTAVTAGLEVAAATPADWEAAMLAGFSVWRDLRDQGSGIVLLDLDARTIALRG
jgi:NTP pyrophosphatase (non-canonical NTP hydrolase)